ncbi:lim-type zinc finger protein, putative, partial [Ichthyophthirius multifiliis]
VSKQKKRFDNDGYSLDLAYITENIIAMGYPSQNYEKIFRNSMKEVYNFLNERHKNHYKVYNLCSERKYQKNCFDGMFEEYPFDDHQPPTLQLIYKFCESINQWLNQHPYNVVAVHCKAGKGRTGVMICCYLLFSGQFEKAYDAIRYYGIMRTKNKKGVTIPSQIRYITYFQIALNNQWNLENFPEIELKLKVIKLITVPNFNLFGGCRAFLSKKLQK